MKDAATYLETVMSECEERIEAARIACINIKEVYDDIAYLHDIKNANPIDFAVEFAHTVHAVILVNGDEIKRAFPWAHIQNTDIVTAIGKELANMASEAVAA